MWSSLYGKQTIEQIVAARLDVGDIVGAHKAAESLSMTAPGEGEAPLPLYKVVTVARSHSLTSERAPHPGLLPRRAADGREVEIGRPTPKERPPGVRDRGPSFSRW
jgi:hypothetical protein